MCYILFLSLVRLNKANNTLKIGALDKYNIMNIYTYSSQTDLFKKLLSCAVSFFSERDNAYQYTEYGVFFTQRNKNLITTKYKHNNKNSIQFCIYAKQHVGKPKANTSLAITCTRIKKV